MITYLGAVLGVILETRLPDSLKKALNNTLGIAAIAMGIVLILKVKKLSAVVLTLVIGSILGELVMLDARIRKLVTGVVHTPKACCRAASPVLPVALGCRRIHSRWRCSQWQQWSHRQTGLLLGRCPY